MIALVRRLAGLLAAGAVLLPATPAQATDWLPIFTANAVQVWGNGQLPPCGPIHYEWVAPVSPDAAAEAHVDRSWGAAAPCTVRFNPNMWPRFSGTPSAMCVEVLHEVGHLYGHDHAEGGVMASGEDKFHYWRHYAPTCARLVKQGWHCKHRLGYGITCTPYATLRKVAT